MDDGVDGTFVRFYYSTMLKKEAPQEYASVKLPRAFVSWLKIEAAKKGVPMYEAAEALVQAGLGKKVRPWR